MKPEFVVNASEFNDVKNRLAMLGNHLKVDKEELNSPRWCLRGRSLHFWYVLADTFT